MVANTKHQRALFLFKIVLDILSNLITKEKEIKNKVILISNILKNIF